MFSQTCLMTINDCKCWSQHILHIREQFGESVINISINITMRFAYSSVQWRREMLYACIIAAVAPRRRLHQLRMLKTISRTSSPMRRYVTRIADTQCVMRRAQRRYDWLTYVACLVDYSCLSSLFQFVSKSSVSSSTTPRCYQYRPWTLYFTNEWQESKLFASTMQHWVDCRC